MGNFKRIIKVAAAVLFTVFIRFLAAQVSGPDPVSYSYSPGWLVDTLGEGSIAGALYFINYVFLAFIFIKFENRIQGGRLMKGLKFSSIGFVYFWGFMELIPLKNPPILQTIKFGFIEGGICIMFFMLMSFFFGTEAPKSAKRKYERIYKLVIVAIAFLLEDIFPISSEWNRNMHQMLCRHLFGHLLWVYG